MNNIICECGGDVVKLPDGYQCLKCQLKVLNKFMYCELSNEQIQALFFKEELEFNDIVSKNGYKINVKIYANNRELCI